MSVVGAGEWSAEQTQRIGSTFMHCNLPDTLHIDSIYYGSLVLCDCVSHIHHKP